MNRFLGGVALSALFLAGPAHAEFEIEGATTKENSVEMELNTTVFIGDEGASDTRFSQEVGVEWGAIWGWSTGMSFEIEKETGESPDLSGVEWSNTFSLIGPEGLISETGGGDGAAASPFALGFHTSFEFEFDSSDDVVMSIGPTAEFETAGLDVRGNLFGEIPLGGGEDAGLSYGVGASLAVMDELAFGVEVHGSVAEAFGDAPDFSDQEHFAGPTMEFQLQLPEDKEIGFRLGAFFGLTKSSPSFALSLITDLEF